MDEAGNAGAAPGRLRHLTTRPHHLAQIVAGALRAEGIEVVVERDVLGQVYGLHAGRHGTRLYVPEDQLVAARALISDFEAPPAWEGPDAGR